jgi:hypothetical protein
MTRKMGDAIHLNVSVLAGVSGLQVVAGYVTGSADIVWTAADWAMFPGIPHVEIDQGYTGAPVYSATVQDVETGAWTPASVPNWQAQCTAARPTVYCNQSTLPAVLATGWRGNLWLAIPGWQPGNALPSAPGCTVVAVQNQLDVANAYDLSVVLDSTWPEADMTTPNNTNPQLQNGWQWCSKCQGLFYGPNVARSVCPAGGQHGGGTSNDYSLLY